MTPGGVKPTEFDQLGLNLIPHSSSTSLDKVSSNASDSSCAAANRFTAVRHLVRPPASGPCFEVVWGRRLAFLQDLIGGLGPAGRLLAIRSGGSGPPTGSGNSYHSRARGLNDRTDVTGNFSLMGTPRKQRTRPLSEGARLYHLLTKQQSWIHRRVDRTDLNGDGETTRRISFDLTIPPEWAIERNGGLMAPLMLLTKRPLCRLDVRGAGGDSLPLLSKDENGALAAEMIDAALRGIHGGRLTQTVKAAVKATVFENDASATEADVSQVMSGLPPVSGAAREDDQKLVLGLLTSLATRFMFIVLIPAGCLGKRVNVKVTVTEDILRDREPSTPRLDSFNPFTRIARSIQVPLYVSGSAASVHYEFRAPPGTVVADVMLHGEGGQELLTGAPCITRGFTAHLTGLESPPPVGEELTAMVYLDPVKAGIVRQTVWTTLLVAAIFIGLVVACDHGLVEAMKAGRRDSLAAAALALPALFLTLQARRAEHAAVAHAFFVPRFANFASALLLYGVAVGILLMPAALVPVLVLLVIAAVLQTAILMTVIVFYTSLSDPSP